MVDMRTPPRPPPVSLMMPKLLLVFCLRSYIYSMPTYPLVKQRAGKRAKILDAIDDGKAIPLVPPDIG